MRRDGGVVGVEDVIMRRRHPFPEAVIEVARADFSGRGVPLSKDSGRR